MKLSLYTALVLPIFNKKYFVEGPLKVQKFKVCLYLKLQGIIQNSDKKIRHLEAEI